MEFDKSNVYTALNADELKLGSKVAVADSLSELQRNVKANYFHTLESINAENYTSRFVVPNNSYILAYLVPEPEKKKLKWTDLSIGDVIKRTYINGYDIYMVTGIDTASTNCHIGVCNIWLSDQALEAFEKVEE